jgi:hypothetical protein
MVRSEAEALWNAYLLGVPVRAHGNPSLRRS